MKTKKLSLREYVDFVLSYIPEMNIETIEQWYSFNECQKLKMTLTGMSICGEQ